MSRFQTLHKIVWNPKKFGFQISSDLRHPDFRHLLCLVFRSTLRLQLGLFSINLQQTHSCRLKRCLSHSPESLLWASSPTTFLRRDKTSLCRPNDIFSASIPDKSLRPPVGLKDWSFWGCDSDECYFVKNARNQQILLCYFWWK